MISMRHGYQVFYKYNEGSEWIHIGSRKETREEVLIEKRRIIEALGDRHAYTIGYVKEFREIEEVG